MSLYKIRLKFNTVFLPVPMLPLLILEFTPSALVFVKEQKLLGFSDNKHVKIQNTRFLSEVLPSLFCLFHQEKIILYYYFCTMASLGSELQNGSENSHDSWEIKKRFRA